MDGKFLENKFDEILKKCEIIKSLRVDHWVDAGLNVWLLSGLIVYGDLDVIKHYVLRLVLSWKGYTPLNYARFLDYATKLIFLRKVGAGYIFIHLMFMEHFAAMKKKEIEEAGA